MQEYYDGLLGLPEEEKALFWETLKKDLPNSFRFCGSKGCVRQPRRPQLSPIKLTCSV
jgi:hypothetical protein